MNLSYDGIEMEMLHISDWLREFVYTKDETSPLYLHHYLRCTCWLNPNLTCANQFPDFTAPDCPKINPPWLNKDKNKAKEIKRSSGTSCVETDVALIDRLSQPRRKLKVWLNSKLPEPANADDAIQYLLEAPIGNYTVDALHGPTCRVLSVVPIIGDYSLCLDLEFEAHLPVCPTNKSPILSNRWTCYVQHNPENHLAQHVYSGEAVFRNDVIEAGNLTVDQFRAAMMLPIPPNFKRYPPTVVFWPGGNGFSYQIVEDEQSVNFPGGVKYGVVNVRAIEQRKYYQPVSNPATSILESTGIKTKDTTGIGAGIGGVAGFVLGGGVPGAAAGAWVGNQAERGVNWLWKDSIARDVWNNVTK